MEPDKKCRLLISEVDDFQAQLNQRLQNPHVVEVRQLRSNLLSELRALEKLQDRLLASSESASPDADFSESASRDTAQLGEANVQLLHALRSSNLPFYEAVWTTAKLSCSGIVAFWKRFYWEDAEAGRRHRPANGGDILAKPTTTKPDQEFKKRAGKDKRKSVVVDIVADDGEEWVKVSTISESRLLFEMAKKGWEKDDTDSSLDEEHRTILRNYEDTDDFNGDDDDADDADEDDDDDDDKIELIKLAADMRKAANTTRVRYRHPRIRFVIPKIQQGKTVEVDRVLSEIRKYDIQVECGAGTIETEQDFNLSHLLPNQFKRFTPTLNVDCTLLLAIVSDLSHFKHIMPSPGLHAAILRQIEVERQRPLLPSELWPAMGDHGLVCTEEAVKRMREIVSTIGTETERKRASILLADPPFEHMDRQALLDNFQRLSDYHVPAQWRIPVMVVESQSAIQRGYTDGRLPMVAHIVAETLSKINHSVFFYGWATGVMTISSNRTVVKQIETSVEDHRGNDDRLEGPLVWVCDTARSLIGKEKDRKT